MKCRTTILVSFVLAGLPVIAQSLTVDEILLLKENGVSEKTIQMMLESEARAAAQGEDLQQPIVQTIVRSNGKPAIIYSTGGDRGNDLDDEERRKEIMAWEMLRHLIVDTRKKGVE